MTIIPMYWRITSILYVIIYMFFLYWGLRPFSVYQCRNKRVTMHLFKRVCCRCFDVTQWELWWHNINGSPSEEKCLQNSLVIYPGQLFTLAVIHAYALYRLQYFIEFFPFLIKSCNWQLTNRTQTETKTIRNYWIV